MWTVARQSAFRLHTGTLASVESILKPSSSILLINRDGKRYRSALTDKDFLHESILPSDHFQKSLPHLPIPKLEETCAKYLKSQEVMLGSEDFKRTETIVKDFENGAGKILHEELVASDKASPNTSYISEPWFDMYLKDQRPVVLNHNPYMVFNDDTRPEYMSQLLRATNMVVASGKFMKTLRANVLEPEVFHLNPAKTDNERFRKIMKWVPQGVAFYGAAAVFKAFALDMSQYSKLFNGTRIPREGKDELYSETSAKHLVVQRNGNFYIFDLFDKDGSVISPGVAMSHLKYILEDTTPAPEYPIGPFTSENRNTWAKYRNKLLEAGNEEVLRVIDSGAFVLGLDSVAPTDPTEFCRQFHYGDCANRWFDKTFSLLIAPDGRAGVNMEHSWGDGVAVLRYFNEIYKETTKNPCAHPDTQPANVDSGRAVRRLEFKLTDEIKQGIREAQKQFAEVTTSMDMQLLEYNKITKKTLKSWKLSPDSFMQLSFQMAHYKLFGKTPATYESCSTAAFKHGRTETIRSATMATKTACELFAQTNPVPSNSELRAALEECSKVHGQLTKEAAMGKGWDRHLFAMRYNAEKKGQTHDIYQDPAYKNINHIIISTSTLSSPALLLGGFSPVVPDGYGVGYGTFDERIGSNVTTYPARNGADFMEAMRQSFDDMYEVLSA